jgi:hypothetical protein
VPKLKTAHLNPLDWALFRANPMEPNEALESGRFSPNSVFAVYCRLGSSEDAVPTSRNDLSPFFLFFPHVLAVMSSFLLMWNLIY